MVSSTKIWARDLKECEANTSQIESEEFAVDSEKDRWPVERVMEKKNGVWFRLLTNLVAQVFCGQQHGNAG